ncbi:larval cuticle protein 9-like [Wyeomyia smithii]|uniref:larval cuticle protein 9-like n=1 Tax=Wyeomyia smithii TaxID=174621 RepID=UPI002467D625|nr:larval cuticle protein 9-like [Wyeomyia smithii]
MRLILVAVVVLRLNSYIVLGVPLPASNDQIEVIDQFADQEPEKFNWSYVLSDGRTVSQSGFIKELEDGARVLVITGSYSYIAPDGTKYTVDYSADENGYHPVVTVGENVPPLLGLDHKLLLSLVG